MPLPLWLIPVALKGVAGIAGAVGVGAAAQGAAKFKKANDALKSTEIRHKMNISRVKEHTITTSKEMDKLGKLELEILHSFNEFSEVFELIKNKPTFETYSKNGVVISYYEGEKLKEVSIGAGVLLGGIGGAGLGAAGGFAAAGATTAAVMSLGAASTGASIASLSGVAATNATLAVLGGGTLAAGGGGMAAGAFVLGVATLGVGLFVGGLIFNLTGGKLSEKADEAWAQMREAEVKTNAISSYLFNLRMSSKQYYKTLTSVNTIYENHLNGLKSIVNLFGHKDWNYFTPEEKKVTENTALLVGLLYNMCKVELVLQGKGKDELNTINTDEVQKSINNATSVIAEKFSANSPR